VHTFVSWEYANRVTLAAQPEVKKYADYLRLNYPIWHRAAISARNVYLAAKTSTNKDGLDMTLAVLRAAMAQAQQWLASAPTATLTP